MMSDRNEMFRFATALAREMVNHKFIIVGLDSYEWRELRDLLLTNGEFTSNQWTSNDETMRIRLCKSASDIRGLKYKGARPSLFMTSGNSQYTIPHNVFYTLDPKIGRVKHVV